MTASDKVWLFVDGVSLTGWRTVSVSRSLDAAAGRFSLALDRPQGAPDGHSVRPGQAVRVDLGDDVVITGYIDAIRPFARPDGHGLTVSGRSKTADLVDCSAINRPGQWRGARLIDIARALAAPFDITVREAAAAARETVLNFEIEQSETVFAAIERLIRPKGLLAYDTPDGALLLTLPAGRAAATALINLRDDAGNPDVRNNVLESEAALDLSARFSEVTVKGQQSGTDFNFGRASASVAGKAGDLDVGRHRPLIVIAETAVDPVQATRRAEWEVARRMGRSTRASFKVAGWRQSEGGPLWNVDLLVPVRDDAIGIASDMLITEVTWTLTSGGGRETGLTLQPPDAYRPRPVVPAGQGVPYGFITRQLAVAKSK